LTRSSVVLRTLIISFASLKLTIEALESLVFFTNVGYFSIGLKSECKLVGSNIESF